MAAGARVGILPREAAESMAGDMLVWEAGPEGMRATLTSFEGYDKAAVDILFVPEDDALAALHESADRDALGTMRRLVRDGHVIFFVMKTGGELRALGYEELLESLGLAFLGACR